jgi:hypothetical protein
MFKKSNYHTQMQKLFFVFFVIFTLSINALHAQQTLRFGNVTLKDTAGSIKQSTGGLYTNFAKLTDLILSTDEGPEFVIGGHGLGMLLYMENNIGEFYPEGVNLYVPFYPAQYTSSGINTVPVGNGALVMNTSTNELYSYLGSDWKALLTDEFIEIDEEGLNPGVPFYLKQYTSSEIGGLSVSNGAMVIDSDTGELLIFLNDVWNTVSINPK